ncbi:MAG: group 1 truncated hemoglobin [Candidatus Kapabacteria bacterium]|nr:group 1 truncated hemoglobin [Candidatus Kapabacteria bacterium]
MKHSALLAFCLGFALAIGACKKEETTVTPTPASLYDRVGGTAMVNDMSNPGTMIEKGRLTLRSVVDSSIFVIAADPKMQPYFPTLLGEVTKGDLTGFAKLSKNFTDFMCVATGSKNYTYGGLNMKAAHDPAINKRIPMKISNADFDAFVGDIGTGLAKNGVTSANNAQLVTDLVALLNTTRADIVQK